jgi:hypothetical protein
MAEMGNRSLGGVADRKHHRRILRLQFSKHRYETHAELLYMLPLWSEIKKRLKRPNGNSYDLKPVLQLP